MVTILTIWRLTVTASVIACSVIPYSAGGSELRSEVIPLTNSKAEEVALLLKQSAAKVGSDIIADIRSNSLLVFGSREQIEMAKRIASTADAPILIEAAVLELELANPRKAGAQYPQSTIATDRFLGSSVSWFTNLVPIAPTSAVGKEPRAFTYVAGLDNGFNSTLAALADEHRVKFIQKPRIQTSSGVAAKLFIGQTIPYVGRSVSYSGSYCGGPHYNAPHEVGLGLEMIPEIVPDGPITVAIKTTYETVPNTTTTSAAVSVTVENGDMLLLGGAIHNRKRRFRPIASRGALLDRSNHPLRIEQVILLRFAVIPPSSDYRLSAK